MPDGTLNRVRLQKQIMELSMTREGRTQTQVLASVADYQYNEGVLPRQKKITESLPITKGATSNNCAKLVDSGLLNEDNSKYSVQTSELVSLYKEHLEASLSREHRTEHFDEAVNEHNKIRTQTKKELDSLVRDADLVQNVLIEALVSSLDTTRIQTLREVLLRTDEVIRSLAHQIVTNDDFHEIKEEEMRALFMLAVTLNHQHGEIESVSKQNPVIADYLPGNVPEQEMIEYLRSD